MTGSRGARAADVGPGTHSATDIRSEQDAVVRLTFRMAALRVIRVLTLAAVDGVAILLARRALVVLAGFVPALPATGDRSILALVAYSVFFGLAAVGSYRAGDYRRDPWLISLGVTIGGAGAAVLSGYLWPGMASVLGTATLAAAILMVLVPARLLVDRLTRSVTLRGYLRRRVLLIGDENSAAEVLAHFDDAPASRMVIQGRLAPGPGDETATGRISELPAILRRTKVDVILITQSLPARVMDEVVGWAFRRGVQVELVPAVVRALDWDVWPQRLFGCAVLEVRPTRLGVPQMAFKRLLDVGLALILLLVSWPLMLLIAVAVRLDSAGPVLFRQTRAGLGGRTFEIWKFRTMRSDADALKVDLDHLNHTRDPRLFKIPRDPRVTRVGRWLRRFSLDELPQLFNILKGDMSFVGPRPFFPGDLPQYEPHHLERLTVLPGLTGLWQVSGRSEVIEFERVVDLDRSYIREWSLFLDLKIMLQTIPAVLRRRGAF